jgi:hypothetical protein
MNLTASKPPDRNFVWPGRSLRAKARAIGLDPDQIASAIRARACAPRPGDDRKLWDHAFRAACRAARRHRGDSGDLGDDADFPFFNPNEGITI